MKIGIDIGGSHIAVGLVNNEGKIINVYIYKCSSTSHYIISFISKIGKSNSDSCSGFDRQKQSLYLK